MSAEIWKSYSNKFDMTNFQPEDNGLLFKLLCSIQQMLVQVQNLYVAQRDLLRNQLNDMCKILPRTYNELQDLAVLQVACREPDTDCAGCCLAVD
jgi:hypothetical protein